MRICILFMRLEILFCNSYIIQELFNYENCLEKIFKVFISAECYEYIINLYDGFVEQLIKQLEWYYNINEDKWRMIVIYLCICTYIYNAITISSLYTDQSLYQFHICTHIEQPHNHNVIDKIMYMHMERGKNRKFHWCFYIKWKNKQCERQRSWMNEI